MKVVASGEFDRLVGLQEDGFIDFKAQPYFLDSQKTELKTKYEFAVDVAALANASRGLLLLGCKPTQVTNSPQEVVKDIRLFKQELLDVEQILQYRWERKKVKFSSLARFVPIAIAGMLSFSLTWC